MPEVSVEVVLHPVPAILGRCQCPAPHPPPHLHVPWLLLGILPKQWVAGDWCSPKEQAEGTKQWDERLGGTGRCPRSSPGTEQGELVSGCVCPHPGVAGPACPCPSLPAGVALLGSPSPYGCLEMRLTPLDG